MIRINGLNCGYPGFRLHISDIHFPAGRISCIIGPNGSGKSTLIRALNGSLAVRSGKIDIDNRPLPTIPLPERARLLATVSQHSEYPDLSVEEFLLLGRIPHQRPFQFQASQTDRAALREAVQATGIDSLLTRALVELSGGERQLCQITRALVQQPKILLLDEPSNFLDIGHQVQALDLVRSLVDKSGLTVVMVLHDLNLAGEYAQRLLLLDRGRPYRWGTADEVLRYEHIEAVYHTPVIVQPNPLNGKPHLFVVSAQTLAGHRASRTTDSSQQ